MSVSSPYTPTFTVALTSPAVTPIRTVGVPITPLVGSG